MYPPLLNMTLVFINGKIDIHVRRAFMITLRYRKSSLIHKFYCWVNWPDCSLSEHLIFTTKFSYSFKDQNLLSPNCTGNVRSMKRGPSVIFSSNCHCKKHTTSIMALNWYLQWINNNVTKMFISYNIKQLGATTVTFMNRYKKPWEASLHHSSWYYVKWKGTFEEYLLYNNKIRCHSILIICTFWVFRIFYLMKC